MRQRALVMFAAHRHGNGAPDAGFDMNDKAFFFIADENGQRVLIRGKNAKDLHPHDIRIHILEVPPRVRNDNDVTDTVTFLICIPTDETISIRSDGGNAA